MPRHIVDIITMGCSKNLVDSEHLMAMFKSAGIGVFHNPDELHGDIAVVNTCGFIGDAKEESIEMILSLCEKKAQDLINQVYVMGCLSERYRNELIEEIPEVDKFYGKFDWKQLLSDLNMEFRVMQTWYLMSDSFRIRIILMNFARRVAMTSRSGIT